MQFSAKVERGGGKEGRSYGGRKLGSYMYREEREGGEGGEGGKEGGGGKDRGREEREGVREGGKEGGGGREGERESVILFN